MKGTELLVCGSCLILALTLTLCEASPAWRPQGRFGKRARVSSLPRVIETGPSDEGVSSLMEVPVEQLYTRSDLAEMKTKPWLCTNSRVPGYPACGGNLRRSSHSSLSSSTSSTSRMRNIHALADYFNNL